MIINFPRRTGFCFHIGEGGVSDIRVLYLPFFNKKASSLLAPGVLKNTLSVKAEVPPTLPPSMHFRDICTPIMHPEVGILPVCTPPIIPSKWLLWYSFYSLTLPAVCLNFFFDIIKATLRMSVHPRVVVGTISTRSLTLKYPPRSGKRCGKSVLQVHMPIE